MYLYQLYPVGCTAYMVIMYFKVTLLMLLVLFLNLDNFKKVLITRMAQSEAYNLLYREWHMVKLVMSCADNLDGTSA
jgi:hypothetical protein